MIEVNELRKVYEGGAEAVRGVDFEVGAGEVFGLLGPNGAGKSTTVGMLTTTIVPTSGNAWVAGYDVVAEPIGARSASSVVFQEPVVDRSLSGRRNLELHARLWGTNGGEVDDVVELLQLGGLVDRPVGTYSGGERRRLEIGRALVSRPRVLFLDEPTVGLDPRVREELLDVVASLRAATEMTILLTTHYLDEAERLCDRVAVMHAGRIVALDTPRALLAELGSEILELRVRGHVESALAALRNRGVDGDAFAIGSRLTLALRNGDGRNALATVDELGIADAVGTRRPTLDDVYLRLTGDSIAAAA